MARTVDRTQSLDTVTARARLKRGRQPIFSPSSPGKAALGYPR
jgi:hypothetical protein